MEREVLDQGTRCMSVMLCNSFTTQISLFNIFSSSNYFMFTTVLLVVSTSVFQRSRLLSQKSRIVKLKLIGEPTWKFLNNDQLKFFWQTTMLRVLIFKSSVKLVVLCTLAV